MPFRRRSAPTAPAHSLQVCGVVLHNRAAHRTIRRGARFGCRGYHVVAYVDPAPALLLCGAGGSPDNETTAAGGEGGRAAGTGAGLDAGRASGSIGSGGGGSGAGAGGGAGGGGGSGDGGSGGGGSGGGPAQDGGRGAGQGAGRICIDALCVEVKRESERAVALAVSPEVERWLQEGHKLDGFLPRGDGASVYATVAHLSGSSIEALVNKSLRDPAAQRLVFDQLRNSGHGVTLTGQPGQLDIGAFQDHCATRANTVDCGGSRSARSVGSAVWADEFDVRFASIGAGACIWCVSAEGGCGANVLIVSQGSVTYSTMAEVVWARGICVLVTATNAVSQREVNGVRLHIAAAYEDDEEIILWSSGDEHDTASAAQGVEHHGASLRERLLAQACAVW
jgi:hypothetical protein